MVDDYITVEELARRLNYRVKTVRNKVAEGVFKKGIHYSTAPGLPMMFKWSAIVACYQFSGSQQSDRIEDSIPMARGYYMKARSSS